MTSLDSLNAQQRSAALDTEGAVLVTAGAGSGKTRLLTHRIAHIIEDLGVRPFNVLAITFTNKAADEMRARLRSLLPEAEDIWISTFHSMCARMLRRYGDRLGYESSFTIYATDETERTVKQIIKEFGYDLENLHKTVMNFISNAKNAGKSPSEYAQENPYLSNLDIVVRVSEEYEKRLKKNNAMDFDDLLGKTHELFAKNPDVLQFYANKFRYIHVDEFQDTNTVQYGLVRQLASAHGNVFAVGDEDQSIYGWRGADVSNMQSFIEDFGAKIYKLEQNYRSTKNILASANNLIKHNVSRIDKKLWSDLGEGERIHCYNATSEVDEAEYVVTNINKLMREGYRPRDFAILMRVNALTRLVEQRLLHYNIPYKVYGGYKFFDRKEVKDVIAYLRVIANPSDDEALLRVINFPKRGIGDSAVSQIFEYARRYNVNATEVVRRIDETSLPSSVIKKVTPFSSLLKDFYLAKHTHTVAELTEKIIKDAKIREVYSEPSEENTARKLNIDDFISSVNEFVNRRGGTLTEFLEEVTLYTEGDEEKGVSVFISTVHSAKGMEFRNVFVIGVEDGLFPLSRAEEENEIEEERRLMYVAITRAKERLFLTYAQSRFMYGDRKLCRQSRFFGEIDERFVSGYGANAVKARIGIPSAPPPQKVSGVSGQNTAVRQNGTADVKIGSRVMHKKFGEGVVEGVTKVGVNSYVVINFKTVGKITLSLAFAPVTVLTD